MLRGIWLEVAGAFLIALGVVLLLNALGITHIGIGDVFLGALAVLLILAGFYLLRRSRRTLKEPFRDILVGSLRVGDEPWELAESTYQLGVGEMVVDLTRARMSEGEHRLALDGMIGQIRVLVPRDIGVSAQGQVTIGSLVILGQQTQGLSRSLSVTSPDYPSAGRKVRIAANLLIGEVNIVYQG